MGHSEDREIPVLFCFHHSTDYFAGLFLLPAEGRSVQALRIPVHNRKQGRVSGSTGVGAGASVSEDINGALPGGDAKIMQERIWEREPVLKDGRREQRRRAKRHNERGAGKLKAIIYTLILVLMIYSAVKILPAYVADYQLKDKMQEIARFAVVNRYGEEQIRDNIYKTIKELEIPAKREDIKVSADTSQVKISLNYTVPVDILFYHLDLHFSPSSENKSVI
jgi:hypothetical protein